MRNDPPPPNLLLAQNTHKPEQRMKRPAHLKRANALVVLAFEEEVDLWLCGLLVLEGGIAQGVW